jgi:hypothetical protein
VLTDLLGTLVWARWSGKGAKHVGRIRGVALDGEGNWQLLVHRDDGSLVAWSATDVTTENPC